MDFFSPWSYENELPEGVVVFDPDESPQHPRKRLCKFKGKTFWHTNAIHPVQTLNIKRDADGRTAAYPEELRQALTEEDQKDYPYVWKEAFLLDPSTPEGLARNIAMREAWFKDGLQGKEKADVELRKWRKVPGHSLSNELKKKYKSILGAEFSPTQSKDITNRGKRVAESLGHPESFDEKYIKELWDLGNQAETTLGRALYLGRLEELKKSADKVAKKVLTEDEYRIFLTMFDTTNLSVIAAQLSKSPQQIHAMQPKIMQKLRKALNLPEPKEMKYESKDGSEWNPIRLNMRGHARLGAHDPNPTDEESYD